MQEIRKKLQGELDKLETEMRIHLPKEIKRALEFGDLRENSEYQTALQRQTMVKARIRELRHKNQKPPICIGGSEKPRATDVPPLHVRTFPRALPHKCGSHRVAIGIGLAHHC